MTSYTPCPAPRPRRRLRPGRRSRAPDGSLGRKLLWPRGALSGRRRCSVAAAEACRRRQGLGGTIRGPVMVGRPHYTRRLELASLTPAARAHRPGTGHPECSPVGEAIQPGLSAATEGSAREGLQVKGSGHQPRPVAWPDFSSPLDTPPLLCRLQTLFLFFFFFKEETILEVK